MSIAAYLEKVKERLLTDPLILEFQVVKERQTVVDAHLRIRALLQDQSMLEFSEYVQRTPTDEINVVTYSYHWADTQGNLIHRWDNTPHFPLLPGFPHHIHNGAMNTVNPGEPIDIFGVLDRISRMIDESVG